MSTQTPALDGVTRTALLAAAARAAESRKRKPLFVDRFARRAAGRAGAALLDSVADPSLVDAFAVRTRWFDDRLRDAVAAGARVVVLLGCGLDARPNRLRLRPKPAWICVDRRPVIAMRRALPRVKNAVDLAADVLDAALWARIDTALDVLAVDPETPRVYVMEGLLCHLHAQGAKRLIDSLLERSPRESHFLFDLPTARAIGPGRSDESRRLDDKLGVRLRFGCDEPLQLLGTDVRGSVVYLGHDEARYGRVPHAAERPWDAQLLVHATMAVTARARRAGPRDGSSSLHHVDTVDVEYYDSDYPSVEDAVNMDERAEALGLRDDVPRYLELLRGVPGAVLDLFCGTGRLALPLLRESRRVVAVDISAGMLARLERKLPSDLRDRIELVRADATRLDLPARDFAAAILPFHGLNCLLEQKAQLAVLRAAAAHLRPRGLLLLDVVNPLTIDVRGDTTPRASPRRINVDTGRPYARYSLASPVDVRGVQHIEGWYDEADDAGKNRRRTFRLAWRLIHLGELELMIEAAGFDLVTIEGGFHGQPAGVASSRLFAIARKKSTSP